MAAVASAKEEEEKKKKEKEKNSDGDGEIDLKMRMIIKDGDALIADSERSGGFLAACAEFSEYVSKRFG